jgi:hypothetical protein
MASECALTSHRRCPFPCGGKLAAFGRASGRLVTSTERRLPNSVNFTERQHGALKRRLR